MPRGTLLKRLERAEESAKALTPLQLSPFDEDALAIYSAMSYLDATMEPSYHDVEPTAAYARGQELRDALYGPIVPAYLDEHLKRYTRASGEFEFAFGREPKSGDILGFEHSCRRTTASSTGRLGLPVFRLNVGQRKKKRPREAKST